MRHDTQALHSNIRRLRTLLPLALLSNQDFDILLAAEKRITGYLTELGDHSSVWGPVHGDVHYDNVLIHNQEVRPIDFTGLRLAHYVYDIGVTVYHIFHQGSHIRKAFFLAINRFTICQRTTSNAWKRVWHTQRLIISPGIAPFRDNKILRSFNAIYRLLSTPIVHRSQEGSAICFHSNPVMLSHPAPEANSPPGQQFRLEEMM
jgi:hypothetical protein